MNVRLCRHLDECAELVKLRFSEREFTLHYFQSLRALLDQTVHLFRSSLLQLSHGPITLRYPRLQDSQSLLLGIRTKIQRNFSLESHRLTLEK